jgi:endonuclease/exonuclease/phosphatase family metal-dependent hydrolase
MRKLLPGRALHRFLALCTRSRSASGTSLVEELDSPAPRYRSPPWLAIALALALVAGPRHTLASPVTLMSYNLYLGADLAPVLLAPSLGDFVVAVGTAYGNVQQTDFNLRANAIADQIAATNPHFIGLQEVTTWSVGPPVDLGQTPPPATTVTFDFLQILTTALAARGLSYAPVAAVQNLEVQVPGAVSPTQIANFGFSDRDVLLAMTNLPGGMTYANPQAQNFATALQVPLPIGATIEVPRGWTAVDVTVDGKTFRLVNTHLEAFFELVQFAQAMELLAGPGNTALPLAFIGDFNSLAAPPALSPGATYQLLLDAGFIDAGTLGGIGNDPTCCQAADLLNDASLLLDRLDLALIRGAFKVLSADVLGEEQGDRIASGGLWPSDHAGIVVTLKVPEPSILLLFASGLGLLVLVGGAGRRRAAR